jgi:hypothetical protein
MTTALEGGEGSASRPGRSLPPGKTRYPLYRRLGGPQGRYGQVRKLSPPIGIRSPDRPARSQSLYRLSYPAHLIHHDEGILAVNPFNGLIKHGHVLSDCNINRQAENSVFPKIHGQLALWARIAILSTTDSNVITSNTRKQVYQPGVQEQV